ncbi:MAG TPA: hypothetical protein VKT80_09235 [Chloroflexota bacterium]|nr:hypothetical protein [Chloroflexota bacterium]
MRPRIRLAIVSFAMLALFVVSNVASVGAQSEMSTASLVSGVVFTGSSSAPTITVTGSGFGTRAPIGYPNNSTGCGAYTNNGDVYGKNGLWFLDDTHVWQAGEGKPPAANCIGLIVQSWSPTQVVFQFGDAYGTFDHWTADPGDNFVIDLKGYFWGGVVSYS